MPGAATVLGNTADGFLVSMDANGHRITGDEPAKQGGTDLGPTPYDLLAASLASCTAMTLNFFARRENPPLEQVGVSVRHDRIHAQDCADCVKTGGRIDRFSSEIRLRGNLDDAQRKLLLKIADRCPVHQTLKNEITISSRLV